MTLELILAVVSVAVLCSLILIRNFGLSYAQNSTNDFLNKSDTRIIFLWNWLVKFHREIYRDVVELTKDLPHIFLNFLSKLFYFLYKKTKKLVDIVKGNKIKTDRGSVSIYLKKIEDSTENNKF